MDVAVIGAGPGGSASAAFLAQAGLRVALIDKLEFPRDKTCGDALSPMALSVLDELGIGELARRQGHRVERISITSPAGQSVALPIPTAPGYASSGLVIRRLALDDMIRQSAVAAGALFLGGTRVEHLELDGSNGLRLQTSWRGRTDRIQTRAAILATGASLALLRQMGLLPRKPLLARASRAYFEGVPNLDGALHFRFDGVPLPGYGWLFPLGSGEVNIGAGFYAGSRQAASNPQAVLESLLQHPPIRSLMHQAQRRGPVKGFPLRMDFHRSPSSAERLLLVGECAGLVNPFTGEGIDYALESARLAAETLLERFQDGNFWPAGFSAYDQKLRRRFQRLFVATHLMRGVYMNNLALTALLRACGRWKDSGESLAKILLSFEDPLRAFSPRLIWRVLLSLRFP